MFQSVSAPSGWHVLSFKARASQELRLQLWWGTTHGGASEETSRWTTIPTTGDEWHSQRILFQTIGDLTSLRLDPGNAAGQVWEIDSITLESVGEEQLTAWADELVARIAQGTATATDATELSAVLEAFPKTPLVASAEDWNAEPTSWRYTIFAPAADWTSANFSDEAWSTGLAPFGSQPETQIWTRERGRTRWADDDIWLRHEFELAEIPSGQLSFRFKHDNAVDVYINGVLAAQMAGFSDYMNAACSPEAAAALKPGSNVIAVHCFNDTGPSAVDVGLYAASSNDQLLDILNEAIELQPGTLPLLCMRGKISFRSSAVAGGD